MSVGRSGIAVGAGFAASGALLLMDRHELAFTGFLLSFGAFCFQTEISLNWQIGLGSLLGIGFGLWLGDASGIMGTLGGIFISALKMLIAPMVLLSIVVGIGRMGDARELGVLGARTVALYLLTMLLAVITGLVIVNLVQPGTDSDLLQSDFFRQAVGSSPDPIEQPRPLGQFLLITVYEVLANPFASIAAGKILPIVVFAILLGVSLLQIGSAAQPLLDVLGSGYVAVMRIIGWVILIAPVGIAVLLGNLIATIGFRDLIDNLLAFALVVIAGILVHAAVTLPLVALLVARVYPLELFRGIREAMAVAFTTSSSTATLPVTTRCVETNLGVPARVSSFVLPLGATVNMDGTALYEAIAAVFVAAIYGIELSLGTQLVIVFVAMATAIGAPGIPSAGMVTMVAVLQSVGLPVEAVAILITIDRFLDTFRTMANVEGDAVVAVCVARTTEPAQSPYPQAAR
ncbi:MAG: dicarboxylate/amino acid:cation symporter [Myxococcota bacterium]